MPERFEVSANLCGIHAEELGWSGPVLGYANSRCWACLRKTVTLVIGVPGTELPRSDFHGELVEEQGKVYYIVPEQTQQS